MVAWTETKQGLLRQVYGTKTWEEILETFPGHTKRSIWNKACKLGLKKMNREVSPEARAKNIEWCKSGNARRGKPKHGLFWWNGKWGKACTGGCERWRPLEKFGKHKGCSGGVRAICTTCEGRQHYKLYRDRIIANVRKYQVAHPEENRLRKRAANRRRHGRKVDGRGVSAAELRTVIAAHNGNCAYCGAVADTIDHRIPLSRGGKHEPENIVPACRTCNFRKHTKTDEEFILSMRNSR